MFPTEHLVNLAHVGMSAILIFVNDIDVTPHGYQDFNDICYRANQYGLDVYAYSYLANRKHPEDEDAEEFYENLYGRLFDRCPYFKGLIFVGESCEFPSKDPHTCGVRRLDDFKDGNMQQYHGEVSLGMLSSKIHAEGPIGKDRTSFNIGARLSYFDKIVQPMLKAVADNENAMTPYANVNYHDITAKLTHRISDKQKLSALFYMGKDINDVSPSQEGWEEKGRKMESKFCSI
jgi:hypothetical protein